MLGGTGQVRNYSTEVSLSDAAKIADRAIQVIPSLKHAELVDHWVGLRPGRVRLRLEAETLARDVLLEAAESAADLAAAAGGYGSSDPGSRGFSGSARHAGGGLRKVQHLRVVHNYGHGGSGLTLAWGTAGDAVQLVLQMLQ